MYPRCRFLPLYRLLLYILLRILNSALGITQRSFVPFQLLLRAADLLQQLLVRILDCVFQRLGPA